MSPNDPPTDPPTDSGAHPAPVPAASADPEADLSLLRAYEPVLAYTRGEYFLPTDVERYVAAASLWRDEPGSDQAAELVPAGELDLDRLLKLADEHADRRLYLRYVDKPATKREVRRWHRENPTGIRRTGRLAAVGLLARLLDVLLRLSLLIRGSVPGGVMTAAARQYRSGGSADAWPYYGRVARDGGYTILQYWYFYAANDWRTTFGGVNDHEADWEMVTVYLASHPDGVLTPAWVAFSSHDYTGDDLRRRWDDPDLSRVGDHPVAFAGAGSHSGAFLPGDYVVTVNPKFLGAFARLWKRSFSLLSRSKDDSGPGFGIPFIDYARGDGVRIGPGQDRPWSPVLISDATPWVARFRGMWGVDTRDWAGGERAPSGPRYERDGTVRPSWSDPLGWAGLHKVPPDRSGLTARLEARVAELDLRIGEMDEEVEYLRTAARTRQAEVLSLRTAAQESRAAAERHGEAATAEASVSKLIRERTALAEERAVHRRVLTTGLPTEVPQAHVRNEHRPYDPGDRKHQGALLQIWATVSVPLLVLAVTTVLLLPEDTNKIPMLLGILAVFGVVEAFARRRLMTTALSVAIVVVLGAVVLDALRWAALHARVGFLVVMGVAALVLLAVNVRDFFRR
jgi:hypothetical protein